MNLVWEGGIEKDSQKCYIYAGIVIYLHKTLFVLFYIFTII